MIGVTDLNPFVTEREYIIHYYEIDYQQRALPTTLINYFQDIALFQSEQVGIGLDFLQKNHLAWSLYQWDILIKNYPVFGQKLKVSTNACYFEKFNAYREFKVTDEHGELMVYAFSRWVLLDTEKMRLTKIPKMIYQAYGLDPDQIKVSEMSKLDEPREIEYMKDFTVRYSDIDTNKHVNNAKYVEWAIETIPLETVLNYSLNNIKAMYKKETKYGTKVQVRTEIVTESDQLRGLHQIVDEQDTTLCLLETTWKAMD